jgi:hypothetical protein
MRRRRRRRPGRTAFWYKYIPLAMDVSDQNVFLSKYIIFSHSEICWGGKGSVFAWPLFSICLFMFGVKI